MRSALFIALLLAHQPAPPGNGIAATDAALEAWKACLVVTTDKWARLSEDAATIAEGVFGNCSEIEQKVRNGMLTTRLPDGSAVFTLDDVEKLIVQMHDVWRPKIIARVLASRAARRP